MSEDYFYSMGVEYLLERWRTNWAKPKPTVRVTEMPVRKVKGGYQYGSSGKVYRGKGAKSRAGKQGRAIQASKRARGQKN